jgi:pullulanase/glycogen debranching enzyme
VGRKNHRMLPAPQRLLMLYGKETALPLRRAGYADVFDRPDGTRAIATLRLTEQTTQVWHGYVLEVRPGQLYGYRVHGPYEPAAIGRCREPPYVRQSHTAEYARDRGA